MNYTHAQLGTGLARAARVSCSGARGARLWKAYLRFADGARRRARRR